MTPILMIYLFFGTTLTGPMMFEMSLANTFISFVVPAFPFAIILFLQLFPDEMFAIFFFFYLDVYRLFIHFHKKATSPDKNPSGCS